MIEPTRVEAILDEALEKSPAERAAFLEHACEGHLELRQEVERLLAAHSQAEGFLDHPAVHDTAVHDLHIEGTGNIGPYKLLEQIGEGGMGTVWMAQQIEPVKRLVAIKLIKAGMDSKQVIARFEAERQALALMDHQHIARVLDAGTTDAGRPYFVMDLVKGTPITKYCDEHHLTPRQRLELFIPICQAVQHAHHKGIIHRDLKPSNVLVALYDGKPVPKVIDFGVAKAAGQALTEKTLVTGFGNIVGTLEYMSPEQAEINQLDIDTRSDIYSLGVLLYELLAGSPPFSRKELEIGGMFEMLRMIREQEPSRPSTKLSTAEGLPALAANRGMEPAKLTKLVRGELDWIAMKALEKDRNRRYETANGFAMDVQRYLADEPVLACPPSAVYRLRKFARRNRLHLALAASLLLLLLGAAAFAWHTDRQATLRRVEVESREREELARLGRNAEAVKVLLDQCENALRADRADRATIALEAAELRAAEGGAEELAPRMARYRKDLDLLSELNEIDTFRYTIIEGSLPDLKADVARWRSALASYVPRDDGLTTKAAGQAIPTLVRDRVLTALDLWLGSEPSAEVRALLRAADPDVYRDAVRDALATGDAQAVKVLAAKPEALEQPAHFAAVLGQLRRVPPERRRAVLESALRARPWDLGLLMAMGDSYRGKREEWAAERARWFQAAVAAHPENAAAHNNLGVALNDLRKFDAAIAEYEIAIRLAPKNAGAHNNLAISLVRKKNLDGAIAEYQKAHLLDPKSAAVLSNWGRALVAKKDFEGGIAKHREAIGIDKEFAPAHYALGVALSAKGDWKGAISHYKEAIRLDGENAAGPLISWGVALWRQKDLDGALAKYEEAIKIDQSSASAHTNRGVILWAKGKRDAAFAAFREGVRLDAEDVHAHGQLGNALALTDDPAGALPHLQKAVQLDPESEEYRGGLLLVLVRLGRLHDAIPVFEQLLMNIEKDGFKDKDAPAIIHDLIACHEKLKQFDRAENWWRKWLAFVKKQKGSDSPAYATELRGLGLNLLQQEKWTDAEPILREYLALCEKNTWMRFEALSLVGGALLGQEKYSDAEPLLAEGYDGMKRREKSMLPIRRGLISDAALRLVQLYDATDKKGDAAKWRDIRERQEGARVGPMHAVTDGAGLALKGKLDATTTTLVYEVKLTAGKTYAINMVSADQKALDPYLILKDADGWRVAEDDDSGGGMNARITYRAPRNGVYRIHATSFNVGRGEFTLTVREKKEGALDTKDAADWAKLAAARYKSKDLPGAIDGWKKAVALQPEDAGLWNDLGAALHAAKDLPGANDAFKRALAINAQDATAWANLGIVLSATKDVPGALDAYKKAVTIDEKYDKAHNSLAWLLATCAEVKLRNPSLAVDHAKKAVNLAPRNPNYPNTLGAAYFRTGDCKAAIAALEKSLELRNGGDSFDWFFLAMAHWRLDEKGKAREWYDRAVEWMDRNQPTNEELRRFRAEAAELLMIDRKKG